MYNISGYKTIKIYLLLFGVESYEEKRNSLSILTPVIQIAGTTMFITTVKEIYRTKFQIYIKKVI